MISLKTHIFNSIWIFIASMIISGIIINNRCSNLCITCPHSLWEFTFPIFNIMFIIYLFVILYLHGDSENVGGE